MYLEGLTAVENFFEGASTGQWPIQESVVEGLKIAKKFPPLTKLTTGGGAIFPSTKTHDRGGGGKPQYLQQKMYSKV